MIQASPNDRFGLNDTFGRFWGKHVAQQGQARYPTWQARYPDWADFISCLCPKCLSKSDHWVVCFMTAFLSLIMSICGVDVSLD